jgi:hypothetical protein
MKRDAEIGLYPEVATWLARYLRGRYPKAIVVAYDTHSMELAAFLRRENLHGLFKDYDAYEIQVDVTGIVQTPDSIRLAFIECKVGPITLRDVGHLLGYSLVARPEWSYLLSPAGLSDRLNALLVTFGRQDILSYARNRSIRLATWSTGRREVDLSTLIPKGSHI